MKCYELPGNSRLKRKKKKKIFQKTQENIQKYLIYLKKGRKTF